MFCRIMMIAVAMFCVTACGPMTFTIGSSPRGIKSSIVEKDERSTSDRIAIVNVSGMIMNARSSSFLSAGEHPVSLLHEQLEAAANDRKVKAIILRLNTPGGTVTASDAMYRELLRFKKRSNKPVVALMMDVAASGGYYLACGADHIVAYPSTITGSIGVIMQTMSFKPLMDKVGVSADAITSGPNKDVGSPFNTMSNEHRKILKGLVDDFYKRFTGIVRESRKGIPADKFDMVTDGRIFSGEQAVKLGVVDELGDVYDAWSKAKSLAGVSNAHLVTYHRPASQPASPYSKAQASPTQQINFAQFNFPDSFGDRVGFYYLWQPSLGK